MAKKTEFPFTVVYNKDNVEAKWIILTENIKTNELHNLAPFNLNIFPNFFDQFWVKSLLMGEKSHKKDRILPTDTFRKPTIQEYFTLSKIFKKNKFIFNKKTHELLTKF